MAKNKRFRKRCRWIRSAGEQGGRIKRCIKHTPVLFGPAAVGGSDHLHLNAERKRKGRLADIFLYQYLLTYEDHTK